jgi:hypothetical protein
MGTMTPEQARLLCTALLLVAVLMAGQLTTALAGTALLF